MTTFQTFDTDFAAYLRATHLLEHIETKVDPAGVLAFFVFADPEQRGADLQLAYEKGAQAPCRAAFLERRYLRRSVEQLLGRKKRELQEAK